MSSSSLPPNTINWIRIGLLALPISGLLTAWATLTPQPNPTTEFEAWSRFVTTTEYLISHLLGTNLGIILLIFGVIALGAYIAKEGGRSGRLGLVAMVIIIAANALALMSAGGWSTFAAPAIGRAYLSGIEDAMRIDVGIDYIVIFMLVIVLAFIGSIILRGGCLVWIFIYQQQPTNTTCGFIADGNKRRVDSLERFPTTFTCCSTTAQARSIKESCPPTGCSNGSLMDCVWRMIVHKVRSLDIIHYFCHGCMHYDDANLPSFCCFK
jgi:hypothetical protein